MRKIFTKMAVTVLGLGSVLTFAQKNDLGAWYMYFGNNKISKKLNWHNEIQYRNFDAVGDLEQLLIRTGIGYDLTENNNNVLLGYGFILSQPYVNGEKKKILSTEFSSSLLPNRSSDVSIFSTVTVWKNVSWKMISE